MRFLVFFTVLIAIIFYFFYSNNQIDPTFDTFHTSGVITNKLKNPNDFYFIVQNYTHSDECSVYEMNGSFVFLFPGDFCLFLDEQRFITNINNEITLYNKKMDKIWGKKILQHHDLDFDNTHDELVAVHKLNNSRMGPNYWDDGITVFNSSGKVVFSWNIQNSVEDIENTYQRKIEYQFSEENNVYFRIKLNSAQIIPPNKNEMILPAFQRGNIIVNDRLNSYFLIINRHGIIVWSHKISDETYGSGHSPRVLANGNILFFQNKVTWTPSSEILASLRAKNYIAWNENKKTYSYKDHNCSGNQSTLFYSKIIEWNPISDKIEWEYEPHNKMSFCSNYFGYQQHLDDGNILVTHISNGGAAFEVNRNREIVWEWINPKRTKDGRPERLYKVTKVSRNKVDPFLQYFKSPEKSDLKNSL